MNYDYMDDVLESLEKALDIHGKQEATDAIEEKFKTARMKLAMKEMMDNE